MDGGGLGRFFGWNRSGRGDQFRQGFRLKALSLSPAFTFLSLRRRQNPASHQAFDEIGRSYFPCLKGIQLGCIAQGLLQYLSMTRGTVVWNHFKSWLKTMKRSQPPSELVVAHALRTNLNDFLATTNLEKDFENILKEYADLGQRPVLKKAA